ncbi:MAG: DUF6290 family protein [Veillonellaceae bacterium]|uniref:type II toxin-antitoxin system RelB family antitoxin n=1 Tax=Anaerovibrio lipolyticus TaxID=82374 RepID=UPI001F1EAF1E|nr:DUF6290 family protein [Anaerovibrio lipolyticus]MCI7266715.1 DUF6290 family protein [Veillonellaceae bacterium]MDY5330633.1 DUF6290 family protein [Anaerovibrio sp.]MCF2601107.1 hypothetical protein [Anaerovibrio lipolyticus]MDD6563188.1 DUF6290 family protein [Veillonellaceae bacterium]MDD7656988.1 DUF6290 family protein [Veillonellaceae bacterium]
MAYSIRLTEEERGLADAYAKLQGISVAEAFKKALFDKIEDEYDLMVAESAYSEYIANGKESRPIQELWEELEL